MGISVPCCSQQEATAFCTCDKIVMLKVGFVNKLEHPSMGSLESCM